MTPTLTQSLTSTVLPFDPHAALHANANARAALVLSTDTRTAGPEDITSNLEARILDLDEQAWWSGYQQRPGIPLNPQLLQQKAFVTRSAMSSTSSPTAHLHNPYAGVPYAWQLTESVGDFLARLPPSTTAQTEDRPWIFICNPYIARGRPKAQAQNQNVRGGEDEAPEEEGTRLPLFVQGGSK